MNNPDNSSMEDRERIMKQDGYLLGIAGASLFSGMHFSPWMDLFVLPIAAILASFYISSPVLLFYFASLTVAVAAVIVAGIPAALFERYTGRRHSDSKSMAIWLAGTIVLAIPAIAGMFRGG